VLVQVVAAVVVGVFTLGIWLTGGDAHLGWLRFFSIAVLVALGVLAIWEHAVWKIRPAQRLKAVPRDVSGTWKGTLSSQWIDPETGKTPPPKTAYLVVRQSASTASIILLTDESRSVSSLATVGGPDGSTSLDYIYLNRPDSRFEHRSRIHYGCALLDITGSPAKRLKGRYWTDRDSKGELDFRERARKRVDDYDEAADLFK